jgi:ribonucleoside-diphosphate reductase alpha chain
MVDPVNNKDARAMGGNPCVTADTVVATGNGPMRVADLIGVPFDAVINGKRFRSRRGFFHTGYKAVFRLCTGRGHSVRLTSDHKVLVLRNRRDTAVTVAGDGAYEWVPAGQLRRGDAVVLSSTGGTCSWGAVGPEEVQRGCDAARELLQGASIDGGSHCGSDWATQSFDFHRGFLSTLLSERGVDERDSDDGCGVVLWRGALVDTVHLMLHNVGVAATIGVDATPASDGSAASVIVPSCAALVSATQPRGCDASVARSDKAVTSPFVELVPDGVENVFDCTVDDAHMFAANGVVVHNCLEQTLESFELCCLVETFPANHDSLEDFKRTLKVGW